MQATMDERDGMRRVNLEGRLDTAGVGATELTLTAMVVAAGRPVIVNLTAVNFLASLGVRMFIGTARSAAKKDGNLVFYAATPAVTEIIDTIGLAEIIDVVGSEAKAVALARA